jgi:DNA-binding NarL/FixJ family response regulator
MAIRLLLADDQPLLRAGLRLILGGEPGIEIVAECNDGETAVEVTRRYRPDLILMDVRMPGLDGLAATRQILDHPHAPPVLMLTTLDDDEVLWGAIHSGAAGILLKDSEPDDLVRAVRTIAGGGSWLDPRVTPRVLGALRNRPVPAAAAAITRLTERESEVLRLMASGANNREIAGTLHVSERTVKSHVGAVFAKLGVRDRAGAIIVAFESGLGDGPIGDLARSRGPAAGSRAEPPGIGPRYMPLSDPGTSRGWPAGARRKEHRVDVAAHLPGAR